MASGVDAHLLASRLGHWFARGAAYCTETALGDTHRTTPEENIQRVRAGFEAFNARDFDTALAGLREDVTWERFLSRTEADGLVRGKDELRAVWESQVEAVDIRIQLDELIAPEGNIVIAPTRMVAHGSGSGITLSAPVTWVCAFDAKGLIASVEAFDSPAEAFEALARAE